MLHAGLDLHLLVAGEDDPDVDVAGVRLLLPQEVVHPRLDVVAEASRLQPLRSEPILLPRAPGRLVATLTFEPKRLNYELWIVNTFEPTKQRLGKILRFWWTYSLQICSK